MDRRITTAISIIRQNTGSKLSVRELAKRVNLSVWHFTRLFKADTSVSPAHYMRDIRMKVAQGLLEESHLSVKEIAAQAGFGDRSHFSRDFKTLSGQSPSSFRANGGGKSTYSDKATLATKWQNRLPVAD
jgi:two-component system, response regulator YesN